MCSQPAVISTSAGGNGGAAATSSASASSCAAVTVVYETRTQIATILTTVTAPSSSVLSAKVSATLRRRWGSQ
ncbi:hypothetical protein M7I_7081 [Glarea lozoyensis 74030]|uniref:Uncharacterized protein n=1 Tax=Glarea lozoyensis (strain ATCC 74030 / MF5533) TaxID=1104152 RepID=H0EWB8_GLAL7|nr:hypothetical protein M7I_7081 [Glarea lozoyensis 74030]